MQRDYSIDILKCLAALIITWSHFEKPLGDYSFLATGGAFGDALFFFCSGYTLFLGRKVKGFFNWYKNRINRIYPTVFAWALIRALFLGATTDNMLSIILKGGGFFVSCIMLFYIGIYLIKEYAAKYLWTALLVSIMVTSGSYFFIDKSNWEISYIWQWSMFFAVMLLGAIVGKEMNTTRKREQGQKTTVNYLFCLCSIVTYYALIYAEQKYGIQMLRMFTIIPLMSFTYSLHKLCTGTFAHRLYKNKYTHLVIMAIGGLCLEIYLVQPRLLTDKFNSIFPLNLLLMYAIILVAAYLLRCLSRIWMQTFKDGEYNWKDVFKLY